MLQVALQFPGKGLVYDYQLDDGGITKAEKSEAGMDDEDEDSPQQAGKVCSRTSSCFRLGY